MKEKILASVEETVSRGPFSDSWDSLENYEIPQWYEDAKFGIFIHWGVYSVPAFENEWYARSMYQKGSKVYEHHRATYGPQSEFGYKDFIPMFKAEKYDPRGWAELFKQAGARFVVPVAEHHDGFQMYESELSRWNAAAMGPRRDLIGDLAEAVKETGLVFGLSSHRAEHWFFFEGGKKFDSDVQDPEYADLYGPAEKTALDWHDLTTEPPSEAYMEDWLARTAELVEKYQPQLVWFDWWIQNLAFRPYLKKFWAYYYNKAAERDQGVAINYKYEACPVGTAVLDLERGQLAGIRRLYWQTDTSVSRNSWGFVNNHDYKEAAEIVRDLADIVSKNGALLLNIGPRADGTIPEEEQRILLSIGEWLQTNGEAIYETRPWLFYGEGPTQVASGAFTDTNRTPFTSRDIRYTSKGNDLFAIVMNWPEDGIVHLTLTNCGQSFVPEIGEIKLLGNDKSVEWEIKPDGVWVNTGVTGAFDFPKVLKLQGPPRG